MCGASRLLYRTQTHQQLVLMSQMAANAHSSPLHPTIAKAGREEREQPAAPHLPFLSERKHFPRSLQHCMFLARNGSQDHPGPIPGPGRWACYSGLKSIALSSLEPGPWPAGEVSISQLAGRKGSWQACPQRHRLQLSKGTWGWSGCVLGGVWGGSEEKC